MVGQIKTDLDAYQRYDEIAAQAKPLADECRGAVGFSIKSVKVALTTLTDDTASSAGAATLPVGGASFGPSLGGNREVKGTETLTFSLYPRPTPPQPVSDRAPPAPIDPRAFPIAASLQRLRDGLLLASQKGPCVSLTPPAAPNGEAPRDEGGTFVFGFTVTKQFTAGSTVRFVVFSLGATTTLQRQAGNTITVAFVARPGASAFR